MMSNYEWTIRNAVVLKEAHIGSSRWHDSPYMATKISSDFSPVPICIMLKGYTIIRYRWPRARPQQLQCVGNGATAVPHQAIAISVYSSSKCGDTSWGDNGSENDE